MQGGSDDQDASNEHASDEQDREQSNGRRALGGAAGAKLIVPCVRHLEPPYGSEGVSN
jgi:hypothetical protein